MIVSFLFLKGPWAVLNAVRDSSSDERTHEGILFYEPDAKKLIASEKNKIDGQLALLVKSGKPFEKIDRGWLMLRIQNYGRKGLLDDTIQCMQKIEIRMRKRTAFMGKSDWYLRDEFLVTCTGNQNFSEYGKYIVSYGNFLHIEGLNRLIFWNDNNQCIERVYGYRDPHDTRISKDKCRKKIKRLHSAAGRMDVRAWNLAHLTW